MVGEIASLAHEVGDDTVEGGAFVAETFLAGTEGAEVVRRFRDDVASQLKTR